MIKKAGDSGACCSAGVAVGDVRDTDEGTCPGRAGGADGQCQREGAAVGEVASQQREDDVAVVIDVALLDVV